MGRSIGHDEWEREVTQDLDERGRVRVVAGGVTVSFGRDPSPDEVAAFLAAHAPTEVWEARQAALAQALAAREDEVEALVQARAPAGTSPRIVEAERARARLQVRDVVDDELREARRAARRQREERAELRPLRPLTLDELRANTGGRER